MRAAIIQLTIAVNSEEEFELKDVYETFKDFCADGEVAHELVGGNGEVYLSLEKMEGVEAD